MKNQNITKAKYEFSPMQLNDTKIQEFGRNDGVESFLHCQGKFYIFHVVCMDFDSKLKVIYSIMGHTA